MFKKLCTIYFKEGLRKKLSKILKDNEFTTKLKDDQFLWFSDNSIMGILIIQRGYLQYFNKKFQEIFGYSQEEISNWKKREFYKIVHPDDLENILKKFELDNDVIYVKFRGITKEKKIINIENYLCKIEFDNKFAVLSSYVILNNYKMEYNPIKVENKSKSKYAILINFTPEIFRDIKLISKIKEKKTNEFIKEELIKILSFYKEDCKHLLG